MRTPPDPKQTGTLTALERFEQNPLRFVCGWRGEVKNYFPTHSHPVIELVYHPRGSGVTTLQDGRKIQFEPHGTVIYPAHLRHDQRMFTAGDDICIHVAASPEGTEGLLAEPLYIPPHRAATNRADRFVRTEFLHLSQERSHPTRRVELNLRVTALVVRLLQLNRSSAQEIPLTSPEIHLERARQFISENFAEITTTGEIARHVEVSEDYLRHLFLERGGTSLSRLLNQTKIERVKELLIHSSLPIKEIAGLAGFKTERYLSTRFKQHTGFTPGTYRLGSQKTRF